MISNLKAFFFKSAIRQQREPEVADADEHDRLQLRGAEFAGNFLREFRDIVAKAARAERAEIGEVFAELGGFDAGGLGERFAGNRADAILAQPGEAAQINRKTINRLLRNNRASVPFHTRKLSDQPAHGKRS